MAKIRIDDLPILEDMPEDQTKGIFGGANLFNPDSDLDPHSLKGKAKGRGKKGKAGGSKSRKGKDVK